jgi:penicillin-binding protein 1A
MKWFVSLVRFFTSLLFTGVLVGLLAVGGVYLYLEPGLPSIEHLREVRLQVPLRVYTRDGRLMGEFGEMRRIPVRLQEVPDRLVKAFLAAEDDRFFEHPGLDYKGLLRAASQLALTGEPRQGGSTITMQVARNYFLSPEKTYTRKLSEIILALRIERELTKPEILELYLNKIYLGQRAYGIGAAAQIYYGKTLAELDLAQSAMIAGLPKAPSRFNPIADPERALQRRNYILARMRDLGYIDAEAYESAVRRTEDARVQLTPIEADIPYVAELARYEMVERFGQDAYTGGYRVYTTVDVGLQSLAEKALRDNLQDYDRRHGYRGPEKRVEPALIRQPRGIEAVLGEFGRLGGLVPGVVVAVRDKEREAEVALDGTRRVVLRWEGMSWARPYVDESHQGPAPKRVSAILAPGDVVRVRPPAPGAQEWQLAQLPAVEGAMVVLDPNDGAIRALVGGFDFHRSKFNRAVQAQRQPGSGFKPFVYSAALEAGFTAASVVEDEPLEVYEPGMPSVWRPENADGKFLGPMRLREALVKSRNLVSIRLLKAIGLDHALKHIALFGFERATLPRNLTLALGTATISPMDMARGYAILANGGYRVQPYLIERVDEEGRQAVYKARPETVCRDCAGRTTPAGLPAAPRVISAENDYLMYSMLQDVTRRGTAAAARVLNRQDIAGKTGTTNDWRDAWFNGFTPGMVVISWVGFDAMTSLGRGEVGGKAALPAWIAFMREALAGLPDSPPKVPPGLVTARIDPATGLRTASAQGGVSELFRPNEIPPLGDEYYEDEGVPVAGEAGVSPPPPRRGAALQEIF